MEQDFKQQIRSIRIVHIALMAGVIFFILVSGYLVSTIGGFVGADKQFSNILLIVYNILSVAAILIGLKVFQNKISGIASLNMQEKLVKYREAMIIRAAVIEGPCFMFIVGFLLTGMTIYLLEALAGLLLLTFFFPTKSRLQMEMQIEY